MLGDSNTRAHTGKHTCPLSHFADSTKSWKQLDLACAALRHTDYGYGGSLKTCSGRWISYSLLLWWASSAQDQRISARFVSAHAVVNRFAWDREIFLRVILPSNTHCHVLLSAGIIYGAIASNYLGRLSDFFFF